MTSAVLPELLKNLFDFIDKNVDTYIDRLKKAVEIPSVSAIPENRQDVIKMVHWMSGKLKDLGVTTEIFNIGTQNLSCGKVIDLPPVLLGQLGKDPRKRTVLIYGHLDVQPAVKSDGWDTDPFLLCKKDGKLFGRGSSDDKGPSVGWLNAIEAFRAFNYDIPVNIKFVFEGMEECGSVGLEDFLTSHRDFLEDVDCVCISDSRWLGMRTPCLTYGLRGNCYFHVEVECAKNDLHSGSFGGSVHEAMADLIFLLDSLTDSSGKILIPGVNEDIEPVSDSEIKLYNDVDFCVSAFKKSAGCEQLLQGDDKIKVLMSTWRYPSLSIHGIQGAFSDSGSKTVIPKKVTGKFSIRIVPNQKPEKVASLVINYLEAKWKLRNSPNKFKATTSFGAKPWITSVSHYNYVAARKATKYAYGKEPDLTRIGGSIPITLTFQEITGKNVLVLPIGAGDDNAHSQNEKINIENYIGGCKLMAAYIYELGLV